MKIGLLNVIFQIIILVSCSNPSAYLNGKNNKNIQKSNLKTEKETYALTQGNLEEKLTQIPVGDFPPLPIPTNNMRKRPLNAHDRKLVEEAINRIKTKQKTSMEINSPKLKDEQVTKKPIKNISKDELVKIKNEITKAIPSTQKLVSLDFEDERLKVEIILSKLTDTNKLLNSNEIENEKNKFDNIYCTSKLLKIALDQDIPLQLSFHTIKKELVFEITSISNNCK